MRWGMGLACAHAERGLMFLGRLGVGVEPDQGSGRFQSRSPVATLGRSVVEPGVRPTGQLTPGVSPETREPELAQPPRRRPAPAISPMRTAALRLWSMGAWAASAGSAFLALWFVTHTPSAPRPRPLQLGRSPRGVYRR